MAQLVRTGWPGVRVCSVRCGKQCHRQFLDTDPCNQDDQTAKTSSSQEAARAFWIKAVGSTRARRSRNEPPLPTVSDPWTGILVESIIGQS